jgi:hypothetical protein
VNDFVWQIGLIGKPAPRRIEKVEKEQPEQIMEVSS